MQHVGNTVDFESGMDRLGYDRCCNDARLRSRGVKQVFGDQAEVEHFPDETEPRFDDCTADDVVELSIDALHQQYCDDAL